MIWRYHVTFLYRITVILVLFLSSWMGLVWTANDQATSVKTWSSLNISDHAFLKVLNVSIIKSARDCKWFIQKAHQRNSESLSFLYYYHSITILLMRWRASSQWNRDSRMLQAIELSCSCTSAAQITAFYILKLWLGLEVSIGVHYWKPRTPWQAGKKSVPKDFL